MNPLDKPVHTLLIPLTHLEKLQKEGKFVKNQTSLITKRNGELPVEKVVHKQPYQAFSMKTFSGSNSIEKMQKRTKLKVIHEAVREPTGKNKPPCSTCKTAPCCKAYIVSISKEEYDSGLYGDYAIELTAEAKRQIMDNKPLMPVAVSMFDTMTHDSTTYHLEGRMGEACPFLTEDSKCSIHSTRPIVCRTYTCVGSKIITQEMRDGTEKVPSLPELELKRKGEQ